MNTANRKARATSDRSPPDSSESLLTFLSDGCALISTPVSSRSLG